MTTSLPITVTEEALKAATWSMATHLNKGRQGGATTYTCKDFPELLICKGWSKKKGVTTAYSVMQVRRGTDDFIEIPLRDLDEVARVLAKVRQGVADDIEWERLDPTTKAIETIAQAARDRMAGGAAS